MMALFHPNDKNNILCWIEKQAVYDLQNKNVARGHVVEDWMKETSVWLWHWCQQLFTWVLDDYQQKVILWKRKNKRYRCQDSTTKLL